MTFSAGSVRANAHCLSNFSAILSHKTIGCDTECCDSCMEQTMIWKMNHYSARSVNTFSSFCFFICSEGVGGAFAGRKLVCSDTVHMFMSVMLIFVFVHSTSR